MRPCCFAEALYQLLHAPLMICHTCMLVWSQDRLVYMWYVCISRQAVSLMAILAVQTRRII